MMETPKSTGTVSSTTGRRRLSLNTFASTQNYRRLDISSPLATSSPMAQQYLQTQSSSTGRRMHRPLMPPPPAKPPSVDMQRHANPSSRSNTLRSTDLSSIYTTNEETMFEQRHAHFLQSIQMQRELTEQAAAAISVCRKKYSFNGTFQELSAQRLLLVSQERLILFNRQLDELKEHRIINFSSNLDDIPESVDFETEDEHINSQMRGTLTIDKVILHLNPSFSMKKIDKESSYVFIVLFRHANTIYASQIANVLDVGDMRNSKVKIKELVVFDDVSSDFCVLIEVFAMKICKRWDHKWQYLWDFAARAFRNLRRTFVSDPVNLNNNEERTSAIAAASATSALPQNAANLTTEFRRCGYIHLTRDSLSAKSVEKVHLVDADYPLEGSMELSVRFGSQAQNSMLQTPRPDSTDVEILAI